MRRNENAVCRLASGYVSNRIIIDTNVLHNNNTVNVAGIRVQVRPQGNTKTKNECKIMILYVL